MKGVDGGYRYLDSCKYHFIRVHENLEQHPSNNKSIIHLKWLLSPNLSGRKSELDFFFFQGS